jgi:uncharacterized protein involved in response to NO
MVSEPYRKLFLLGLFSGIVGVGLWPLYYSGAINYPILVHGQTMITGFFLSFVSGFLMTALPKMSGGRPASPRETNFAFGLLCASVVSAWLNYPAFNYLFAAFQFSFLVFFVIRRFSSISHPLPNALVFLPVGLAWGFLACVIFAVAQLGKVTSSVAISFANIGFQQGFLLNLIVGLGSQLIPFLTHVDIFDPKTYRYSSKKWMWTLLVCLNASLLGEIVFPSRWNYLVRAGIMAVVAVFYFQALKKRKEKTVLGTGIRHAVWSIVVGYALMSVLPNYNLALLHIVFIGGYSAITLLIATRVVLAHGGHSLIQEKKSVAISAAYTLLLIAAILRACSILTPASFLWVFGALIWFRAIGQKVFESEGRRDRV